MQKRRKPEPIQLNPIPDGNTVNGTGATEWVAQVYLDVVAMIDVNHFCPRNSEVIFSLHLPNLYFI